MPAHQRYLDTAAKLRTLIVSGRYRPGHPLPTRMQLARQLGVAMGTLQKAVDLLVEDGFLAPRGALGTFVCDSPPHLRKYGIITAPLREQGGGYQPWSKFHEAIWHQATAIGREKSLEFTLYDGLTFREDAEAYAALLDDVAGHRIGGLILVLFSEELMTLPVFSRADLPPAVCGTEMAPARFRRWPWCVPIPSMDYGQFIDRALRFLASRGRRRLGVVAMWGDDNWRILERTAEKYGLVNPARFNHALCVQSLACANHICQLLTMDPERPDALVIGDDNLVPYATAGLRASVRYHPHEMDVVAWCNFPHPPVSHVPIHFMGPDIRQYLLDCLATIQTEQSRRHEKAVLKVGQRAGPPASRPAALAPAHAPATEVS